MALLATACEVVLICISNPRLTNKIVVINSLPVPRHLSRIILSPASTSSSKPLTALLYNISWVLGLVVCSSQL